MSLLHSIVDRRAFLSIGGLGLLGSLTGATEPRPGRARTKSIIFLHQYGGPSHVDKFDMKPDASEEIRGIYRAVPSRPVGAPICRHLPRIATGRDQVLLL